MEYEDDLKLVTEPFGISMMGMILKSGNPANMNYDYGGQNGNMNHIGNLSRAYS